MQNCQTNKFSDPSYQNPHRSDAVVTSGANRGFMAIQDQWRHIIAPQIEEKLEPK